MIRLTESAPALLAVLSIFVIGAVAGVVLDRTMLIPAHADAAAAGGRRGVLRHHDEALGELRAELGLSAAQSRRVRPAKISWTAWWAPEPGGSKACSIRSSRSTPRQKLAQNFGSRAPRVT